MCVAVCLKDLPTSADNARALCRRYLIDRNARDDAGVRKRTAAETGPPSPPPTKGVLSGVSLCSVPFRSGVSLFEQTNESAHVNPFSDRNEVLGTARRES